MRYTLRHLYDPVALTRSKLPQVFALGAVEDPLETLRQMLLSAIEALKPDTSVPAQAPAWRVYRILYERYVEQFSQDEVATHLALGTRQLRRQEQHALQVLADFLWTHYDLRLAPPLQSRQPSRADRVAEAEIAGTAAPSRDQELDWLRMKYPRELVALADIIQPGLRTIAPLLRELGVRVECSPLEALPPILVQPTGLRQALSAVLTVAVRSAPGATMRIGVRAREQAIEIDVETTAAHPSPEGPTPDDVDNLNLAREIIGISKGSLQATAGYGKNEPFQVKILLPVPAQVTVMVIDDNADALQLIERYLARTRYHFIGCTDPEQAITLAEEVNPQIILLDVMLPGIDGWELLGRLREHPKMHDVPIIVCTILAQEQLASVLGAAGFIRKPVSQTALLATLDLQVAPQAKESGKAHPHKLKTAP